jgi:hypothetical protein
VDAVQPGCGFWRENWPLENLTVVSIILSFELNHATQPPSRDFEIILGGMTELQVFATRFAAETALLANLNRGNYALYTVDPKVSYECTIGCWAYVSSDELPPTLIALALLTCPQTAGLAVVTARGVEHHPLRLSPLGLFTLEVRHAEHPSKAAKPHLTRFWFIYFCG